MSKHDDRYGVVKKAIHDWQCLTHVHFEIDTATFIAHHDTAYSDSICTIQVGKVYGSGSSYTLAQTRQVAYICNSTPHVIFATEFDLIFNGALLNQVAFDTNYNHNMPINKFDGYVIFLHELGNAHSLGHIIDNTKLMHYQSMRSLVSTDRLRLTNDAPAYDGGHYILTKSLQDSIKYKLCSLNNQPMHLITSCTSLHSSTTNNINLQMIKIIAHPNPLHDLLTIYSDKAFTESCSLNIYNLIGQQVFSGTIQPTDMELTISTKSWPVGLYIVLLKSNTINKSIKILK